MTAAAFPKATLTAADVVIALTGIADSREIKEDLWFAAEQRLNAAVSIPFVVSAEACPEGGMADARPCLMWHLSDGSTVEICVQIREGNR